MKRNARLGWLAGVCLSVMGGCGATGADPSTGAASHALDVENGTSLNGTSLNGTSLNGTSLNGTSLNGTSLNGTSLNGTSLNGTSLNGTSLNGTSLNGTSLNGTSLNGTSLNGPQLVGAIFQGQLSSGGILPLRLDGFRQGSGDEADVSYYRVSFQADDGWHPLCGREHDGSAVEAIALAGAWDYRQGVPGGGSHQDAPGSFTFACRHHAIAKCVEWGYKPWKGTTVCTVDGCRSVPLAPLHQACTRMVRADYCGDGVSWTERGEVIDFYDLAGVQLDTDPTWHFEAEWSASGARCVRRQRVVGMHTIDGSEPHACMSVDHESGSCGSLAHFADGTTLMDRHPYGNDQVDMSRILIN